MTQPTTMRPSPLAQAIHDALIGQPPAAADQPAPRKRVSALDVIASQPWAILPEALEMIAAIAAREGEGPEAVAARMGRPLQNTRTVQLRGDVALVPVTGPIMRYANLFTEISGATSLEVLAREFTAALDNPAVNSVVLDIDSPGGQASGIAEFARMVAASPKPVTAYVGGMGASAAYWIAAAADELVLGPTAMVGSIGAVVGIDTHARDGVVEIVSSQSPNKRPDVATPEGRGQIQARIDALAQVFIDDVATFRGVDVETVLSDFGQGDVRMGAEAVALGMADRVSTLEAVIAGFAGITKGAHMSDSKNGKPAADEKPAITRDYLEANHADLVAAFRTEGATAERERIQSVLAQSLPGHEKLVQALAFDGATTGAEAAIQVLAAEKQARTNTLAAHKADAPKPLTQPVAADVPQVDSLPLEERCKAKWDADPELRGEYADNFNAFMAYERAAASGKVRILSKGAK